MSTGSIRSGSPVRGSRPVESAAPPPPADTTATTSGAAPARETPPPPSVSAPARARDSTGALAAHEHDPAAAATRARLEGAAPDAVAVDAAASTHAATVTDALGTTPRDITVGDRTLHLYGADEREAAIVQRTLERVPPEHRHAIPDTLVVADSIGGGRTSGGNTVIDGRSGPDRIEISSASLSETPPRRGYHPLTEDGISRTLLHECGHAVSHAGEHGGLSWRTRESLGSIVAAGPESRMADERFAQGYMHYIMGDEDTTGRRGLTPEMRASMERAFTHIEPPAAE